MSPRHRETKMVFPYADKNPAVMKHWLRRRILEPLLALLRQGVSPQRLALSVALGIVIGNIPIFGISTLLCATIALVFRLNLAAIQLAQTAMAPTQLLLIIPFVRLGDWILRAPSGPVSIKAVLTLVDQGLVHTVVVLWGAMLHAGFAWLLVAPCAAFLIYKLLTPMFARAAAKMSARRAAASALALNRDVTIDAGS